VRYCLGQWVGGRVLELVGGFVNFWKDVWVSEWIGKWMENMMSVSVGGWEEIMVSE
jgi:hypothetical protein